MFTAFYLGTDSNSNNVLTLFEDSHGVIWCGTAKGLYRFNRASERPVFQYVDLSANDGVSSPLINSIFEDDKGVLLIATDSGLSRILSDGTTQRCVRFF
jgi:ligand-binding sensor domain-containing protein